MSEKQTTSKPKQLTMAKVKRVAKEVNRMLEYELDSEHKIKYYPVFPQSKVHELIRELANDMMNAGEKDIEITDELFIEYVCLLCIKHFTSLEKGFADNFEDKLLQMEHLVDTGYFKQIIDEVFSAAEIRKVFDTISDEINKNLFIEDLFVKSNEKLKELRIRNKDVLETFNKMKTGK